MATVTRQVLQSCTNRLVGEIIEQQIQIIGYDDARRTLRRRAVCGANVDLEWRKGLEAEL